MNYEEIYSTGCNSCIYYQNCKRIPSDRLSFAHSCFISPANSKSPLCRTLCSDFICTKRHIAKYKVWQNYSMEEWYKTFGKNFKEVEFVLDNDQSVRYSVDYADFFYGNLIVDGKFKAKAKQYFKQTREGFGYKLVKEKLENGVDI